jgi:putative endonuclease
MSDQERESSWYAYVLYNKDRNKIYIGITSDLSSRLKRHNNLLPHKKTSFTFKNSGNWILIYTESLRSYSEAMKREKFMKSGVGRKFIHKNLEEWIKKAQLVDPPEADF